MEYKIIRSKRKTMGIYILNDGSVEVRCPNKISNSVIENFVGLKQKWINEKVSEKKLCLSQKAKFNLDYNSKLLFMGKEYPLLKSNKTYFDGNCFYVSENNFKQNIINLYKTLAKEIITEKVLYFSNIMNLKPSNVKVNSAKTRWGSCSGKNSLNFTWKLVLAEKGAIDYVVIHELAHIKEHNHSKNFWSIVKFYMPDYKNQQGKLKNLQNRLSMEEIF